jgi:hypothetical protein
MLGARTPAPFGLGVPEQREAYTGSIRSRNSLGGTRSIEIFRRQLRWFIDAKVDDHRLNFSSRAQRGLNGKPSRRDSTIRSQPRLALSFNTPRYVLVVRRKAGRKPVGARAMTTVERVRKHRASKQLKTLPPPERNKPGVVGSLSLGQRRRVFLTRGDATAMPKMI